MTPVEQRYAEIAEVRRAGAKVSLRDRVQVELRRVGLADDLFPLFAVAAFVYLACAVALRFTGLPEVVTLAAAAPLAAGVGWVATLVRAQRRRAAFNKQLIDLLELVTGQVQGGVGAERGLMIVSPQMPDPVRSEMAATLAAGQAGKDLIGAMRDLRDRYPAGRSTCSSPPSRSTAPRGRRSARLCTRRPRCSRPTTPSPPRPAPSSRR